MNSVNKKQETRNSNDLLSSCQGNCIREENGYSNNVNGKRLQRSGKLQGEWSNYPATVRKVLNCRFLSANEIYLQDVGKKIANTICSRIYKGIEGDNSNAVLVVIHE